DPADSVLASKRLPSQPHGSRTKSSVKLRSKLKRHSWLAQSGQALRKLIPILLIVFSSCATNRDQFSGRSTELVIKENASQEGAESNQAAFFWQAIMDLVWHAR